MSVKFRVSDANTDHVSYGDEHFPVDDEGFVLIPDHLAAMFASARPDWERIEEPSTVPAAGDTASVTSGIMQASDEQTYATALGERAILEHEGNIAAQEALGLDAEDMQAVTGDTGVNYPPEGAEEDEETAPDEEGGAEEDEEAAAEEEAAGTGAVGSITDTGQVNPGEQANTQSGTDSSTLRNAETSNPENAVNLGETNPPPETPPATPPAPPDDTDQPKVMRSKK